MGASEGCPKTEAAACREVWVSLKGKHACYEIQRGLVCLQQGAYGRQ